MAVKEKKTWKGIWEVTKETFSGFGAHKIMKLSASLAYYTVFSLGPLLIVLISLSGIFFGREAAEGKIYEFLVSYVGGSTAESLQEVVKNASSGHKSTVAVVVGGIILLFGATTVFAEVQDSVNMIWGIRSKPRRGWLNYLKNRVLSFSVIVTLGFLLIVSLIFSAVIEMISGRLSEHFPEFTVALFWIINFALTIAISTIIFGTVFKVLPDAKIRWKDVLAGSFVTSILFLVGKFAISLYVSKTQVGSAYGAAGSLVILLVWVYYSSVILYLGAEFTKAYAMRYGNKITPNSYAVSVHEVIVENKESIQEHQKAVKDEN